MKQYGDPVITVRMPKNMVTGLKLMADKRGTTASEIIRNLISDELKSWGITQTAEPIPGQMKLE